jgi:hypothetical protein
LFALSVDGLAQRNLPDPNEDWLPPHWLSEDEGWQFSGSAGANFTSGKYGGTVAIDTLSFVVEATAQKDRFFASLQLPYLISNGPAVVGELGIATGQTVVRRREHGPGDVLLSGGYNLYTAADRGLKLDASANIKFPTANEDKGLGTGEYDYGAAIDMQGNVRSFTWFASVGYTVYGDLPTIKLNDVFSGSVGLAYQINDERSVSLRYVAREALTASSSMQSELYVAWQERLFSSYFAGVYAGVGLSSGSPDYAVGVSVGRSF